MDVIYIEFTKYNNTEKYLIIVINYPKDVD